MSHSDAFEAAQTDFYSKATLASALTHCQTFIEENPHPMGDFRTNYLPQLIKTATQQLEDAGVELMITAQDRIDELKGKKV